MKEDTGMQLFFAIYTKNGQNTENNKLTRRRQDNFFHHQIPQKNDRCSNKQYATVFNLTHFLHRDIWHPISYYHTTGNMRKQHRMSYLKAFDGLSDVLLSYVLRGLNQSRSVTFRVRWDQRFG